MSNNRKKKRRYSVKTKSRMFVFFLIFGIIISALGYRLLNSMHKIYEIKNQKTELEEKLITLSDEKEVLESDIARLSDPDYIARYVREKYFYSKDGEFIIKIDEKKD